jgi:hypothetical protein
MDESNKAVEPKPDKLEEWMALVAQGPATVMMSKDDAMGLANSIKSSRYLLRFLLEMLRTRPPLTPEQEASPDWNSAPFVHFIATRSRSLEHIPCLVQAILDANNALIAAGFNPDRVDVRCLHYIAPNDYVKETGATITAGTPPVDEEAQKLADAIPAGRG